MNDELDIKNFSRLQRLISLFQRINQLSWTSDQARKRYPAPEAMKVEELTALTKMYLVLGDEIEIIYSEWRKIYDELNSKL